MVLFFVRVFILVERLLYPPTKQALRGGHELSYLGSARVKVLGFGS